jgi:hypothetical protein
MQAVPVSVNETEDTRPAAFKKRASRRVNECLPSSTECPNQRGYESSDAEAIDASTLDNYAVVNTAVAAVVNTAVAA